MRNDGILRRIESTLDHEITTIHMRPLYKPASMLNVAVLFLYMPVVYLTTPPISEILERYIP